MFTLFKKKNESFRILIGNRLISLVAGKLIREVISGNQERSRLFRNQEFILLVNMRIVIKDVGGKCAVLRN